jgi:ATP-grasp domain
MQQVFKNSRQIFYNPFFIKLFNWEYWNFNVIYTPIYFYWFYLCIKAKSLFFFSASNPCIENGGFLMEKKSDIATIIPTVYHPISVLINPYTTNSDIVLAIEKNKLQFPIIIKPDIGYRGSGVKKVTNIIDAIQYIQQCDFPMLLQQFINYKNEVGIFYYRFPCQEEGKISGIVGKEFLVVVGNGTHTIEELLLQNPRYILQIQSIKKMSEVNMHQILSVGEKKILVPFGNHARGAKFIDESKKITPALQQTINTIAKQIPDFFYGRFDIMYNNWDDLCNGKNFSIVELNGAGSEPTHIYDPSHSIFFAWKEIIKHWKILYHISKWNHKNTNGKYLSFSKGIKMFRDNSIVNKKLNKMLQ